MMGDDGVRGPADRGGPTEDDPPADLTVVEVVPGELDVVAEGVRYRFLVPPGVGLPGMTEEELVGAVAAVLLGRGVQPRAVTDVSALLREDPGLLDEVAQRVDEDE